MNKNTRARDAEGIAFSIIRKARCVGPVIAYLDSRGNVQTSDNRSGIYKRIVNTDQSIGPYNSRADPLWIKEDLIELIASTNGNSEQNGKQ